MWGMVFGQWEGKKLLIPLYFTKKIKNKKVISHYDSDHFMIHFP